MQAQAVAKKIPPLERKFWGEKLGDVIEDGKSKVRDLKGRQRLELARLDVESHHELSSLKHQKELAVKQQLRSNTKSFQVPFEYPHSFCLNPDGWCC